MSHNAPLQRGAKATNPHPEGSTAKPTILPRPTKATKGRLKKAEEAGIEPSMHGTDTVETPEHHPSACLVSSSFQARFRLVSGSFQARLRLPSFFHRPA